jgi:hypothetical protein
MIEVIALTVLSILAVVMATALVISDKHNPDKKMMNQISTRMERERFRKRRKQWIKLNNQAKQ